MYKHYPLPLPVADKSSGKVLDEEARKVVHKGGEKIISAPVVMSSSIGGVNIKTSPVRSRMTKKAKKKAPAKRTGLMVFGTAPPSGNNDTTDGLSLDGGGSFVESIVDLSSAGGVISASVSLISGSGNGRQAKDTEADLVASNHFEKVNFSEKNDEDEGRS